MEKVSWMESVDLVFKAMFTRIQMLKLPPKLLKPIKKHKRQLQKLLLMLLPLLLDSVPMAMSVVLFTPTPF